MARQAPGTAQCRVVFLFSVKIRWSTSRFHDLFRCSLTELARTGKLVPGKDDEDERATLVAEILRTTPTSRLKIANYCFQILFGTPDKKNPLISRSSRAKAYWLANYRAAEQQFGNGYIGLIPNLNGTQGNHT